MYSLCIAFTSGVAGLLAWLLARKWLWPHVPQGAKLPPMPPGASFFGHKQLYEGNFYCKTAIEWAKEYGPVYRLRENTASVVILNDYESVKNFYARKEFLQRSKFFTNSSETYEGLATQNGDVWNENRRICLRALRDLGMGKSSAVGGIVEEFQSAAEKIAESKGEPVHVFNIILPCASNNISTLLYGRRFPWHHPIRTHVDKLIKRLVTALQVARLFQFNPTFFTMILKKLPGSCLNHVVTRIDDIAKFSKKQIEEHRATSEKGFDRDFIDTYLGKVEDAQKSLNPHLNMNNLVGIVTGFFIAGTVSTASTIMWHLVKFALEPDTLQAKIQQEIDQVVGSERKPTWEDRLRMPFTMACVWEMDRWKTAVPLGPPREASEDTVIDGFYIPKGTAILANFWAVHFDPNLWKNPLKFDPSRFLNEDGSLMARKPDYLMAFSSGKRSCPGEILATMEIFLAVTTFLQRFNVALVDKIPFDLDDPTILTKHVAGLKLKFLPRRLAD